MLVTTHTTYLAISIVITVLVGWTLHRNGRRFLLDAFGGDGGLADSVNHLLVVGFYLVNVGLVSLALRHGEAPRTTPEAIEHLSTKIGFVLVFLGVMHFINLSVLSGIRRRAIREARHAPPPVPPTWRREPVTDPAIGDDQPAT